MINILYNIMWLIVISAGTRRWGPGILIDIPWLLNNLLLFYSSFTDLWCKVFLYFGVQIWVVYMYRAIVGKFFFVWLPDFYVQRVMVFTQHIMIRVQRTTRVTVNNNWFEVVISWESSGQLLIIILHSAQWANKGWRCYSHSTRSDSISSFSW